MALPPAQRVKRENASKRGPLTLRNCGGFILQSIGSEALALLPEMIPRNVAAANANGTPAKPYVGLALGDRQ
jgi:hypothetical protein